MLKTVKIEERLRAGLRNFKDYCFKNVHTYSKEEFEEKFVKKVRACHIQELDKNFVGSLYRQEENVII